MAGATPQDGGAPHDASTAVRQFSAMVHTRARALGLQPQMAGWDDAISDGMFALWQAARDYDPARGPFPAYAGRRVHWALVDGLRRRGGRGRHRHSDDIPTADFTAFEAATAAAPDPGADGQADMGRVLACARLVDHRLPTIVTLCYYGYSYAEAGRSVGISRERVRQLVAALRKLLTRERIAA